MGSDENHSAAIWVYSSASVVERFKGGFLLSFPLAVSPSLGAVNKSIQKRVQPEPVVRCPESGLLR